MWKLCGWLIFASSAADGVSTELALRLPELVELNWALQHPAARAVVKSAAPLVIYWATEKLYKKHPTIAWIVRVSVIVIWGVIAGNNFRLWSSFR